MSRNLFYLFSFLLKNITNCIFSTLEIVLMIVLYILTTLPILSYSYFNIYNIHYCKYLYDLFSGLGIADKFEGISIFITKSCWFKENELEESESFISITEEEKEYLGFSALNVSSQEDIHVSYQNDTKYYHEFLKIKQNENKKKAISENFGNKIINNNLM